MIVLNKVNKSYLEGGVLRPVLIDVSLKVDTGEFVAIRGASGSGKSTLLNLIAGLDVPESGSVDVFGRRVTALGEPQRTLFRRRHIGFVFQFFSLIPTLTVGENVGFSLELNGLVHNLHDRVAELLEQIGLADRRDSYPDRLSGGEQQRVAIARAIAHSPGLVLADEPTGNLDAQAESAVMGLFEDQYKRHGTTLLIATHSAMVARRAARCIHIERS